MAERSAELISLVKQVVDEGSKYPKDKLFREVLDHIQAEEAAKQPKNPNLFVAAAQVGYSVGADLKGVDDAKCKQIYEKCFDLAKLAATVDPNCVGGHSYQGIMLSELIEFEGTKKKIEKSFEIREHFNRAIALSPDDTMANFCLGKWEMEVASLGWFEKKAAALFFAEPPTATYEEALAHFMAAHKSGGDWWYSDLDYSTGVLLYNMGRKDEAKKYFEKTVKYPHQPAFEKDNAKFKALAQKYL